jgi:hypothetical protein
VVRHPPVTGVSRSSTSPGCSCGAAGGPALKDQQAPRIEVHQRKAHIAVWRRPAAAATDQECEEGRFGCVSVGVRKVLTGAEL